ncbi:Six-hairpin glycosidase [Rhizodiscina lignyota]|uniref:Six-hairpin glycosidase n=1 Tax=Rhizodiscina lignyota TaxID=1504668 RepID=A0A9P4IS37_9PEZI|nr:Six-hairpin glycosidase [Rhizodiscina lignyota]
MSCYHFLTSLLLVSIPQIPFVQSSTHIENARSATVTLQETWYNGNTGLYNTTGWWNAANALTTLADMTAVDPEVLDRTTNGILKNSFNRAQQNNLGVLKLNATYQCDGISDLCPKDPTTVYSSKGWLNGYYDDESWWALAWITSWDLTKDDDYLEAATDIFEDLVSTGLNATCGGIWWDKAHTQVNAIANALFISVAAQLANRASNKDYYLAFAKKQWNWFMESGLINSAGNINDGLDLDTCKNNGDTVWTYNQGVILGAAVELDKADPGTGIYIPKAQAIADAALANTQLVDSNGILHDVNEPNLGSSGVNFKGIFIRNLGILNQQVHSDKYVTFIQKQADAIWTKARGVGDELGPVWSGPVYADLTNAGTHSSAMDALVAASNLQEGVGGYIGAFKRHLREY